MIPEGQIVLRLLIAALLGLVIGYERERQDHAAGLRTHMILIIGAALAMTISINLAFLYGDEQQLGDPARLAAQVVSGIGFLGAGVIFRYGTNIRGLTTAASLWTVTIVGLAIGAGLYWPGVAATALMLLILTLLNYIEDHVVSSYNRVHMILQARYRDRLVDEFKTLVESKKWKLGSLSIARNLSDGTIQLEGLVRLRTEDKVDQVVEELSRIEGVSQVKISE